MRQRLVVPATALLLVAGCSGQQAPEQRSAPTTPALSTSGPSTPGPVPSASPSSSVASSPPGSPTASRVPQPQPQPQSERSAPPEAPFSADRSRDTATHDGGRLSVVDLRFGRHVGYDRVVVELAGDGRPGWFAQYRDVPRHQGRGNRVDIDGRTVLEVSVTGVRYPNERGAEPYEGPQSLRPRNAGVVEEVLRGTVYEGHQQVFIGIDAAEQPFRVFRIPDPPRVVVDIQHPR